MGRARVYKIAIRKYKGKFARGAFVVMCGFLTLLLWTFFTYGEKGIFRLNDYAAHANIAESLFPSGWKQVGYPMYHFLVWALHNFGISLQTASTIVMTAVVLVSAVVFRYVLNYHTVQHSAAQRLLIDFIAISGVLLGAIPTQITGYSFYWGTMAPNVWHNPTIWMSRPFALLMLHFFVLVLGEIEQGGDITKPVSLFALFTVLTVLAKPSAMLAYAPVMAVIGLATVFRDIKKNLKYLVMLVCSVLPLLFILLWQQSNVFVRDAKIIFYVGSCKNINPWQYTIMIVSGATFAVLVLCFQEYKTGGNTLYTIVVWGAIAAWLEFYFFAESGRRFSHGNMGWQSILAENAMLVLSWIPVINNRKTMAKVKQTLYKIIFAIHLAAGIMWMYIICITGIHGFEL
jgi:hypothetical protein